MAQAGFAPANAANAHEASGDFEERLAELEALAANKGGRKLSLRIYGQVNRALLIWDDGKDADAYVVDNDVSSTRVGLWGAAEMKPGWRAGYRVEFEFKDAASSEVSNRAGADEGAGEADQIRVRHAFWHIESDALGRLSLGQQSPASDDITIINLGAQMSDAALHYNNAFALRLNDGRHTNVTWGLLAHNVDALRGDFARYDSPSIFGFVVSAAWGENDIWDAALRYQAEWAGFRFAVGAGYMDQGELNIQDVRGSASLLHTPSGIFVSGAGGLRYEDETEFVFQQDVFTLSKDSYFYFSQIGVKRRWFEPGATSVYGEYGFYKNYSVGEIVRDVTANGVVDLGILTDTEVSRLGLGLEQSFDASALLLYAQLNYYRADIDYCKAPWRACAAGLGGKSIDLPVEDWTGVVFGARIQF